METDEDKHEENRESSEGADADAGAGASAEMNFWGSFMKSFFRMELARAEEVLQCDAGRVEGNWGYSEEGGGTA